MPGRLLLDAAAGRARRTRDHQSRRGDPIAQLDKFIQVLFQRQGSVLALSAGVSPTLIVRGRPAQMAPQAPAASQLRRLISEVATAQLQNELGATGCASFDYRAPSGECVSIAVSEWSGETRVEIRPRAEGARVAAPAAHAGAFNGALPRAGSSAMLQAAEPPPPPPPPAPVGVMHSGSSAHLPYVDLPPTPGAGRGSGAQLPYVELSPAAAPVNGNHAPIELAPIELAPGAAPQRASSAQLSAVMPPQAAMTGAPARNGSVSAMRAVSDGGGAKPIDRLFRAMVAMNASDLHVSSNEIPMVRKDGDMMRIEGERRLSADELFALLDPIVPETNRHQFEAEDDTDFAYEIPGLARFRANLFRDRCGVGAVFRTIPAKILSAEQLGLSDAIKELCKLHKGLVLVTGPTGSGKSTTLCAMIDLINRTRSGHIITIEDPIEFVHENKQCLVNQREVGPHTRSFKRALRAALREDPDVVLVGEMRDLETISIAMETAETGHLVFGTLHTTTAYSTIDRIIDQYPPDQQEQIRVMLSESLKGVVSQTLCKKIGGGRAAALEVLLVTPAVSNLIREGKTFQIPSIMQTGRAMGMRLLNEALAELVENKIVAPDEALAKAIDKNGLKQLLKNKEL